MTVAVSRSSPSPRYCAYFCRSRSTALARSGPPVRTSARPWTITQQSRVQSSSYRSTTSETRGFAAMLRRRRSPPGGMRLGLAGLTALVRRPEPRNPTVAQELGGERGQVEGHRISLAY